MILVVILVLFIIYLFCKYYSQRPTKFPPGPPNYPLIGGVLSMPESDVQLTQEVWLKQYGGVVGIMMGPVPLVFIQGAPYVQDALRKPEFQGRPKTPDFRERSFGELLGIFFVDGPQWSQSRKFTIKFTKAFGAQKLEEILQLEMDELTRRIQNGETYEMHDLFRESTVNIIWTILSGMRCTIADNRVKILLDNLTAAFRSGRPGGRMTSILNLIPALASYNDKRLLQRKATKMLQDFFRENIREHLNTLDVNNPRDLYDSYLIEQQAATGADADLWSEENLIVISMDIFTASYESLNSSMGFLVLYLILNPDVQTKLHEELDKHLGTSRPTLADKYRLDYVQALIHEVFRINTIAPVVAPHRATEDTYFYNYFIPKDTIINMSLWSLLHDKSCWDKPEIFNPDRFLNKDGKFDKNNPNLINFGLGRRTCAGDLITLNVMFMYVTSFWQKYSVHRDPEHPQLSTKAMPGFTTSPQPFRAIIRERN